MPRRVWREWTLMMRHGTVTRSRNGTLGVSCATGCCHPLTPTEVESLFRQLARDYARTQPRRGS